MTTATANSTEATESPSWGEITVRMALRIAHPNYSAHKLAELRRMRYDEPDNSAYWQLMAQHHLLDLPPNYRQRWALLIKGLALNTDHHQRTMRERSAHNAYIPFGLAMFTGGDRQRKRALYSEDRLMRLLNSHDEMLHDEMERAFQTLASERTPCNWREVNELIMSDGGDPERERESRYRIAAAYFKHEATQQGE